MSLANWPLICLGLAMVTLAGLWLIGKGVPAVARLTLAAVAAGGFWGAFGWWPGTAGAFAWALPPLAGRLLAVAGWAFALGAAMALWKGQAAPIRAMLFSLLAALVPLAGAILLWHMARFDLVEPVSIGFFAITGALSLGALISLATLPSGADEPAPKPARAILIVIALITLAAGLALYVLPAGPAELPARLPNLWLWSADPLTTRLIAAMPLAIAAGAVAALRSRASAQTILAMVLLTGLGALLVFGWAWADGAPPAWSYLALWGAAAWLTLPGLSLTRSSGAAG